MTGSKYKAGRKATRSLTLAVLLVASTAPATLYAQAAQGTSRVGIMKASRVVKTADLDFGRIFSGDGGGTIIVEPNGDVGTGGTVTTLGGTGPAAFVLERDIGADYVVYRAPSVSDTIKIVHEADANVTMTVRNFTNDFNRTKQGIYYVRRGNRITGPFTGTVPGYWNQTSFDFRVGGTLDVNANQLAGNYSGTFTVTIDYD